MLFLEINPDVHQKNAAKNTQEAYADKGHGVLLEDKGLAEMTRKWASRDISYPLLKLIICKKGTLKDENEEKIIYYDGVEETNSSVTIRLNDIEPENTSSCF